MRKIFYGWWIVLASFLIAFYVGGIVFYGLTAFFEPIVKEYNWNYTQVSLAFSLRGLEMGILAPVIGFLVDFFGARKLSLFGVLISGLGLVLLGMTNSLAMFYVAFLLLALGSGSCASTVLMTALAHWFRKNVGKAMGIVACGFGAGGILIPLIVWLIDYYQWRTALVILGIGTWALCIPLSFAIRNRPEQYGYLPDGEIPFSLSSDHGGQRIEKVQLKQILKSTNFWKVAIAELIRSMIIMAVVTHVMPYLSSVGMSKSRAAFVATSIPLFSIIGRVGFGWVSDIFDKRHVLCVAYCLLGIGTALFSYIQIQLLIFPFLLIFSPALGAALPLRGAVVREYFGRVSFGSLLGAIKGVAAVGGLIGPCLAGWTFDTLTSYRPIWLILAGTTVVAAVLILRINTSQKISEKNQVPEDTSLIR